MIVRVQSKSGTKRITANSSDLLRTLLEKVSQLVMITETRSSCTTECCAGNERISAGRVSVVLRLPFPGISWRTEPEGARTNAAGYSYQVSSARDLFSLSRDHSFLSNRHGDMLYLSETGGRGLQQETTKDVMEDEIDQLLKKRDGLIQRDRDPQLYWDTHHSLPEIIGHGQ